MSSHRTRPAVPAILVAALGPILWGCNPLIVAELTIRDRPLFTALCSLLPVGAVIALAFRRLPARAWWGRYCVIGLCNYVIPMPLMYFGMHLMPGAVATLLIACQPLFVLVLSPSFVGERASPAQFASVATGLAGVALLVFNGSAPVDLLGASALLAAALSASVAILLVRRWRPPDCAGRYSALYHNGWQMLFAGVCLLPITLIAEGLPEHLSRGNVFAFAWLGFVAKLLGFSLLFWSVPKIGASAASLLTLLTPTTAFLLGFLVKGEQLTALQVIGAALVISAVVFLGGRRSRPAPSH